MVDSSAIGEVPIEALGPLTEIGSGGQGKVYAFAHAVLGAPAGSLVAKLYESRVQAVLDVAALERLIDLGDHLSAGDVDLAPRVAWPRALVVALGRTVGFLMPRLPERFTLPVRLPSGVVTIGFQAQHLLNDDRVLANRGVPVHDRLRAEFLRDIAQTMRRLHQMGVVIGDFSPMNLFLSAMSTPRCFFIDCDAVRAANLTVLQQTETPSWELPRFEELATVAGDSYKFALFAVRLFAGDQDTHDVAAISRISAQLGDLAVHGLSADPRRRPGLGGWIPALELAMATASTALPTQRLAMAQAHAARAHVAAQAHAAEQARAALAALRATVPAPYPRRRRKVWRRLVIAGIVVAGLCVGAPTALSALGSVLSTGLPGASQADETARAVEQLQRVERLLHDSKKDRVRLNDGIQLVDTCADVNGGIDAIQQAQRGRGSELDQARALDIDAVPDGELLQDTLVEALQHSLAADTAYLAWARAVRDAKCTAASRRNFHLRDAAAESDRADAPKLRFVQLWNPLARQYGLDSTDLADGDI